MKKVLVLAAVAALAGCQDYESPGGVADESVWSHVPADFKDSQRPEREERQRQIAELEERVANVDYRINRIQSASEAKPAEEPGREQRIVDLREDVVALKDDLRSMRGLYDDPEAFGELRDNAQQTLEDLEERLHALSGELAS